MLQEFKEFAVKGNAVDMAVGIVIGASFTGVVDSLVKDIITPTTSIFTRGSDFKNLFIVLGEGEYQTLEAARAAGVNTLNYGIFLTTLIDFLIVAFSIFLVIKVVNRLRREEGEKKK